MNINYITELGRDIEDKICTIDEDIYVYSCPNNVSGLYYFKIINTKTDDICRISMTSPEYLYFAEETLVLTPDQVDTLASIFYDKLEEPVPYFCSSNETKNIKTNWDSLIFHTNYITDEEVYHVPVDLPIPDYSKLKDATIKELDYNYINIYSFEGILNVILKINKNDNLKYLYVWGYGKEYKLSLYSSEFIDCPDPCGLSEEDFNEIYEEVSARWEEIIRKASDEFDIILPDTIPDYRKLIQRS